MAKGRVEAFSDGVFAIAITLLVLNLVVPDFSQLGPGGLADAVSRQWPSFVAFAVSFAVIGIIWVNHHGVFTSIVSVDRPLLFINLGLLATVVFMPYATALMSRSFEAGRDESLATAVYGATMMAMALGFDCFWLYLGRHRELLAEPMRTTGTRAQLERAGVGTIIYLATIVLAFINPYVCLVAFAALAVFYVFEGGSARQRR